MGSCFWESTKARIWRSSYSSSSLVQFVARFSHPVPPQRTGHNDLAQDHDSFEEARSKSDCLVRDVWARELIQLMCSKRGIPSKRNPAFRKEIASRRDKTLFVDIATSKMRLASERNASFKKEGVA